MKLLQLRYIHEVQKNNFNVTHTAERLFTSQPGISKQIRELENDLGIQIFERHGKQFVGLTEAGVQVERLASEILETSRAIREIARSTRQEGGGRLLIATTHSQARYVLPPKIQTFIQKHPKIQLTIQQGTPLQIEEQVSRAEVDIGIATEGAEPFEKLVKLPFYSWNRVCLAPEGHPLTTLPKLTLEALSHYPLITYTHGLSGRIQIDRAFEKAGIRPNIVLTASDADVIKRYIRLGLGVGIVSEMAYLDPLDQDLIRLEARHLFEQSTARIMIRRESHLRDFILDFIQILAPHLSKETVEGARQAIDPKSTKALNATMEIPPFKSQDPSP